MVTLRLFMSKRARLEPRSCLWCLSIVRNRLAKEDHYRQLFCHLYFGDAVWPFPGDSTYSGPNDSITHAHNSATCPTVTAIQECEQRPVQRLPYLIEIGVPMIDIQNCYSGSDYLYSVTAEPAELRTVVRRPVVSLRVDRFARVRGLRLIRTSGNNALDRRALQVISEHAHNKNYCERCGVTTVVNIEWNGPIWFHE